MGCVFRRQQVSKPSLICISGCWWRQLSSPNDTALGDSCHRRTCSKRKVENAQLENPSLFQKSKTHCSWAIFYNSLLTDCFVIPIVFGLLRSRATFAQNMRCALIFVTACMHILGFFLWLSHHCSLLEMTDITGNVTGWPPQNKE